MENRFEKEGFHATSRIKKNDEKKINMIHWYTQMKFVNRKNGKKLIVKYWFIHSNQSSSLSKYINKTKVNMIGNYLMMTLLFSLYWLIWGDLVVWFYIYTNTVTTVPTSNPLDLPWNIWYPLIALVLIRKPIIQMNNSSWQCQWT